MRKTVAAVLVASSLAIVVSVAIVVSLYNPASSGQTSGPVTVEGLHQPLKLSMTVNNVELNPGERLNIEMLLENVGNETLTLYFSDGNDQFDFFIYGANETCVYRYNSNTAYPQAHVPEQMKPGDARGFTREWAQVFDAIYDPNHDPHCYYNVVPPGTYRIKGAFISSTLKFTVETPMISLTILA